MKRFFLLSALLVMSILAGWAQTEQPEESGCGIVLGDGTTVKGDFHAEDNDTVYIVRDQSLAQGQSFKLYDFGTQTAWVNSQHTLLNEHISIQPDGYVADSAAEYYIVIMKDSLIVALPGDLPVPNRHGTRNGSQFGGEHTVDGYTFVLWDNYSYTFYGYVTKSLSGRIAIITKIDTYNNYWAAFAPPATVRVDGVEYPVRVIAQDVEQKGSARISTIRLNPNIQIIEYSGFYNILDEAYNIIIEDSNQPLYVYHCGDGFVSYLGAFTKAHNLQYAYIGRVLDYDTGHYSTYTPFAYLRTNGVVKHPSFVLGPQVSSLSKKFFYGIHTPFNLTSETLNPPTATDILQAADFDSPWTPSLTIYHNQKLAYLNDPQWNRIFNVVELPQNGKSGGTVWTMDNIGDPINRQCTGYKMTISPSGNGKMEDKNQASDHGWYAYHKVIKALDIASGVTYISKMGWDGYPLEVINVHTESVGSLPTMGADAFRGVDKNIPVYAKSTVRPTLEQMDGWKEFKDFRDLDIDEERELFKNWMDAITPMDGQCPTNIKRLKNDYMDRANSLVRRIDIVALKSGFLKALFQEGDGTLTKPYLIGNAALFVCFAKMTQLAEYSAICGKLTADIDVSDFGTDAVVSGALARLYTGTFDGNGYSIKVNLQSAKEIGLFGYLAGTVKNLTVDGIVYLTGTADFAGGIVGSCIGNARVLNCVCKATILVTSAVSNGGGLIGKIIPASSAALSDSVLVQNCAFVGAIQSAGQPASYCAGLVGFTSHRCALKNCYTKATFFNLNPDHCSTLIRYIIDPDPQKITPVRIMNCYYKESLGTLQGTEITNAEWLTSGELCYLLNNSVSDGSQAWYQKIGKDDYPHPFSCGEDTVYRQNESYTNAHTTHTFGPDGFCTVCGAVDPNHQGAYQVSTAGQWKHLAAYVDKDHHTFNIELMKDIDLTCIGNDAMVGKKYIENAFKGNFDGHGHTLTIDLVSSEDRVGLFRGIDHTTIKNLEVEGNITSFNRFAGGIVGEGFDENNMQNCISEVNITCTIDGNCSCGGLIGTSHVPLTINNSAFTGKLIGRDSKTSCWGGLVGYVHGAYVDPEITNSYVYATTENISTDSCSTFVRVEGDGENDKKISNCYFVYQLGKQQRGTQVKEEEAKSGYLCYQLNKGLTEGLQAWYQVLDSAEPEDYPYPFSQGGDTVYYDSNNKQYTNTRPIHHHFVNGFCTECGAIDPTAKEVIISSNDNMRRWAEWVNIGHGDVSVKLAADVNYEYIGKNVTYTGTFDGQGHKVIVDFKANTKPAMWANFAGTIRNTYFVLTIPDLTASLVNNFALFDNCQGTIDRCLFRANWHVGNASTYRLGGLINTISGQTSFTDCAFMGYIYCGAHGLMDVKCNNLFIRDVNKNLTTFTDCFEDVYYRLLNYSDFSYDRFIPNATSSPTNCYMYGGEYDSHGVSHSIHYTTLNNLNNGRSVWKWFNVDEDMFKRRPVPFGPFWNGGEGGEDALPQILAPAQRANKYMEEGHIVIQCGNVYYDIFGREL